MEVFDLKELVVSSYKERGFELSRSEPFNRKKKADDDDDEDFASVDARIKRLRTELLNAELEKERMLHTQSDRN
jgi:hypothetical protein